MKLVPKQVGITSVLEIEVYMIHENSFNLVFFLILVRIQYL